MKRVMTSISPEYRNLARRLTEGIFKRTGRPKGEKSGPQYAIHEGLRLLSECMDGKIIPITSDEYETLRNAVLRKAAATQLLDMMATSTAISGLLLQNNLGHDEAARQASELDPKAIEEYSSTILAECINQLANHVLQSESESNHSPAERKELLALARTLMNDAILVRTVTEEQHSTTH